MFARVAIIACSAVGLVISIIQFAETPGPSQFIYLFLAMYLVTVAGEASRQLNLAGKRARGTSVPEKDIN